MSKTDGIGVWNFNTQLNFPDTVLTYPYEIIASNGTRYSSFVVLTAALRYGRTIAYANGAWTGETLKTVEFLTPIENVDLLTWVNQNAEYQSGGGC